MPPILKGSLTAKNGFANEEFVIQCFNDWQNSDLAKAWLEAMNYNLLEIQEVKGYKIKGSFKADVQVQINIQIKLNSLQDVQNLQVKLVSNPSGFNQIDKRWVDNYVPFWDIPDEVVRVLKHFTGELPPYIQTPKDKRRMFMFEFTGDEQALLLNFIRQNQSLIVSDILKGRGQFSAEWMLVILKLKDKPLTWALKPMNYCLNLFGNGEVAVTNLGSIKIGNITIQRKGGDGDRATANMLQFKINPCLLLR